jgi:hypothetical protein
MKRPITQLPGLMIISSSTSPSKKGTTSTNAAPPASKNRSQDCYQLRSIIVVIICPWCLILDKWFTSGGLVPVIRPSGALESLVTRDRMMTMAVSLLAAVAVIFFGHRAILMVFYSPTILILCLINIFHQQGLRSCPTIMTSHLRKGLYPRVLWSAAVSLTFAVSMMFTAAIIFTLYLIVPLYLFTIQYWPSCYVAIEVSSWIKLIVFAFFRWKLLRFNFISTSPIF